MSVDVCIVAVLLTSHAAAEWQSDESLNAVQLDKLKLDALNELSTCYDPRGSATATTIPGLTFKRSVRFLCTLRRVLASVIWFLS